MFWRCIVGINDQSQRPIPECCLSSWACLSSVQDLGNCFDQPNSLRVVGHHWPVPDVMGLQEGSEILKHHHWALITDHLLGWTKPPNDLVLNKPDHVICHCHSRNFPDREAGPPVHHNVQILVTLLTLRIVPECPIPRLTWVHPVGWTVIVLLEPNDSTGAVGKRDMLRKIDCMVHAFPIEMFL